MKEIAVALLITTNGSVLMQHRDVKVGLSNSGKITAFGGSMEKAESPLEAVAREVREETSLKPSPKDFLFLKTYQKVKAIHGDDDKVHFFILKNVSSKNFKVFEGQGFVEVTKDNVDSWDMSVLARQVLKDYLGW